LELLNIDCLGKALRLEGSLAGWQQLFWDNNLVSQKNASADNEGSYTHEFELKLSPVPANTQTANHSVATSGISAEASLGSMLESVQQFNIRLETQLQWQPFLIQYRLLINDEEVTQGQRNTKDIERQVPEVSVSTKERPSLIGLASLAFKLLKSAKAIKVILATATLATYSWLFSFKFAAALIACLVIHEYGHIRAMKHFGLKTKGIYLIPFLGGLALSDDKINTRWQDVVISIMGPTFGLILSVILLVLYWITGNIFFAGLANFNALLNLINLLPILPLDGGHILKSIGFSANGKFGLFAMVTGSVLGILGCYAMGLSFMAFFLLIGSMEIVFEWRMRHQSHLLPLDRYGQIFSSVWYVFTAAALIAIMWYFAHSGDELLAAPLKILRS
jgi:Zn-dependent protease